MTLKESFRVLMCDLWHGPMTAREIVRRHGRSYSLRFDRVFSERRLQEMWATARASGKLPDAPRPHFVRNVVSEIALDCEAVDRAADRELDRMIERSERLSDGAEIANADSCANLLAALIRKHGNDPRREDMDVSALALRAETVRRPTAQSLLEMRRAYDAQNKTPSKPRPVAREMVAS